MKKRAVILAVSGGVDSMTMLHKAYAGELGDYNFIVAHFNHGIRSDAAIDEKLVQDSCHYHLLKFEVSKELLGKDASEAFARLRRYAFLRQIAEKYHAEIWTAHHADDVVETIAINLVRGTGWRGLAVFDNDIKRPLLSLAKAEIHQYAERNGIWWREDSTNTDPKYLRNRLRAKLACAPAKQRQKILKIWQKQVAIKREIDGILAELLSQNQVYERAFYAALDDPTAAEILRALSKAHGHSLTMPQTADFLRAIRRYQSGKKFNLPHNNFVVFSKTAFSFT
jgi:tRNA(Ile)-lysidine synthase